MIRIVVASQTGFPDGTAGLRSYRTFEITDVALEAYLARERQCDDCEIIGGHVIQAEFAKEKGGA